MKQWQLVNCETLRPGEVIDIDGNDHQLNGWPRRDAASGRWVLPCRDGWHTVPYRAVQVYR